MIHGFMVLLRNLPKQMCPLRGREGGFPKGGVSRWGRYPILSKGDRFSHVTDRPSLTKLNKVGSGLF